MSIYLETCNEIKTLSNEYKTNPSDELKDRICKLHAKLIEIDRAIIYRSRPGGKYHGTYKPISFLSYLKCLFKKS